MTASAVNRAEEIAESLRSQISNGKYEVGERLPSERELAERLGVHRSSVREALKKLEQVGMIAIRPGGGARVLPLEKAGLGALRHALGVERPDRDLVSQWMDVYELVIAGGARYAIERGSAEEFAEAKRLLRRLVAPKTSAEEFVIIADQLTELIAVASRNVVLRMVRNGLTASAERQHALRKIQVSRKLLQPIARAIERAIDERDPSAAEEGVRRLLRTNREMVLDLIAGPAS
jgi:GntR family transcriptional repressor for pyruvate dehydrogenase complex